MSNTDKAMELVKMLREKADGIPAEKEGWLWGDWICGEAADYIEAIQKDCRTCTDLEFCKSLPAHRIECVNFDQWAPVEFKQLTRSSDEQA